MIARENVIKGLQCIIDGTVRCESCGYAIDKHGHHSCQQNCASDAIALLKEQETVVRCKDCIDFVYNNSSKHETLSHMLDELLEEKKLKEQCLKTKCVICPHCDNCDVDEMGKIKEQEAVPVDTKMIGMSNGTDIEVFCCPDCRIVLDESFHFCPNCGLAVKWK